MYACVLDEEIAVCEDCFYKYRINPNMPECYHKPKIKVKWNEGRARYETTTCRPFPTNLPSNIKQFIAMCDPLKGTCKKDKCTFAHGQLEQKAWNEVLRLQRHLEQEGKAVFYIYICYNSITHTPLVGNEQNAAESKLVTRVPAFVNLCTRGVCLPTYCSTHEFNARTIPYSDR